MRKIFRIPILPIVFFAAICMADETKPQSEPTEHDRIYHFQHGILPNWTHGSEGKFYEDLLNGKYNRQIKELNCIF